MGSGGSELPSATQVTGKSRIRLADLYGARPLNHVTTPVCIVLIDAISPLHKTLYKLGSGWLPNKWVVASRADSSTFRLTHRHVGNQMSVALVEIFLSKLQAERPYPSDANNPSDDFSSENALVYLSATCPLNASNEKLHLLLRFSPLPSIQLMFTSPRFAAFVPFSPSKALVYFIMLPRPRSTRSIWLKSSNAHAKLEYLLGC